MARLGPWALSFVAGLAGISAEQVSDPLLLWWGASAWAEVFKTRSVFEAQCQVGDPLLQPKGLPGTPPGPVAFQLR